MDTPPDYSEFWMPHAHCVYMDWYIIIPSMIFSLAIFAAYIVVAVQLVALVLKLFSTLGIVLRGLLMHGGLLIATCGITHLLHSWNWLHADYRAEMLSVGITAVVSISFAFRLRKYIKSHATQDLCSRIIQLSAEPDRFMPLTDTAAQTTQQLMPGAVPHFHH